MATYPDYMMSDIYNYPPFVAAYGWVVYNTVLAFKPVGYSMRHKNKRNGI